MSDLVQGKIALVTGGSSGIGRATCQVLAREGATVVVTCVNEKGANETVKTLPGSNHIAIKFDVSDFKSGPEIVKKIIERYNNPPSILVNCAGIQTFGTILDETPENFQRTIDINLKGTLFTSQAVAKELVARELPGSIINVASMTGHRGFEGMSAYTASKHAIEAVTRCASKDLSQYNIRVNSVQPGMIETPMSSSCPAEMITFWLEQLATKRKGQPPEVAEMIAFLASDRASYVNGAHIPVTGGY